MFDERSALLTFLYEGRTIRFWLPDSGDDFVQFVMRRNCNFWERKMLELARTFIKRGSVVVDVGGFIGNHAVYFSRICDASCVITFEPQPHAMEILNRNVGLNGVSNTVIRQHVVLGDRLGRASPVAGLPGSLATTSFCYVEEGKYEVRTLDSYGLPCVDFLKIDVEGSEVAVLRGAGQTLCRCSPVVWVEAVTIEAYERVSACMSDFGYKKFEQISEMDYMFRKI